MIACGGLSRGEALLRGIVGVDARQEVGGR